MQEFNSQVVSYCLATTFTGKIYQQVSEGTLI